MEVEVAVAGTVPGTGPVRRVLVARPAFGSPPVGRAPLRRLGGNEKPSQATFRRRRAIAALLAALLTTLVVLGALEFLGAARATVAGFGGGPLTASEPAALELQPVRRTTYIVQPGDTLWTIARRLQPTGDIRPLVDHLASARDGAPLRAGERVVLSLPTP